MTVLLTLSAIVAGFATYGKLAVNDLPAVDYPVINVTCSYPGANPTTMANNIATPLEKQFLQIPGLDIITSASTQSNTSFTLQFNLSKSITDAATDVQAAIQRATGKLPIDLPSPPTFTKTNPNDQAIYLIGLLSDTLTDGDLYKYASTAVQQRIAKDEHQRRRNDRQSTAGRDPEWRSVERCKLLLIDLPCRRPTRAWPPINSLRASNGSSYQFAPAALRFDIG